MNRITTCFIFALASWKCSSQQLETPREFINMVHPDTRTYTNDSTAIFANLYEKMKNHEASFSNTEYFDSTEIIVDSIMYDTSQNKVAVFVIAKNPIYRNPHSDSKLPYYYNAACYLGKREYINSCLFELKQLGPFSLANFDSKVEIRQAIRHYYFLELAAVMDEKKESVLKYNLDDKRFWESSRGWQRMW